MGSRQNLIRDSIDPLSFETVTRTITLVRFTLPHILSISYQARKRGGFTHDLERRSRKTFDMAQGWVMIHVSMRPTGSSHLNFLPHFAQVEDQGV